MRKEQVRWTDSEKRTLVDTMVSLRETYPIESALGLLQLAELELPDDRRRGIKTMAAVPEIEQKFKQAWAARPKAETVLDLDKILVEVPQEPVPLDIPKVLSEVPLEDLASQCARRFVEMVSSRPASNGSTNGPTVQPLSRRLAPVVMSAGPKLKRFAIVGLLPDQELVVKEKVNGSADLRFLRNDQSKTEIPMSVDFVIVEKHSRHKWSKEAYKQVGRDQVAFVNGVEGVIQKIYDFLSRQ